MNWKLKQYLYQGCPWAETRDKFQPEFAFFLEPERFGINFLFTGIGTEIPKFRINFVHERLLLLHANMVSIF